MLFDFGLVNLIDIILVAFLLFYLYKMMKESGSLNLFVGILIFIVVWMLVSQYFKMPMLGSIMDALANVGVIAINVIFQEEIRRFFRDLGSRKRFKRLFSLLRKDKDAMQRRDVMPLVRACQSMADGKVGALIVMQGDQNLGEYIETGERIDANVNRMLIENIFFKNSPLHDGAMIVGGDRIIAAGCVLPVSHREGIPKHLGLRHRAALGISEVSDAVVIIVSEETGSISLAEKGEFTLDITPEELEQKLSSM